ncbi:MAG: peptidoglycan DD-metalloendopeptidase family protein [Bacteroidota bacterium]|nr:peptidoglycan DD-metalloendopeptidase family protein [Bacteroidota bacterium]
MNELISILEANRHLFEPVVPFDPGKDKLLLLDFTVRNTELNEDILSDIRSFCSYINSKLENERARYGTGGYAEYREVYSKSKVFDGKTPGEEPRRLHLGVDIWGKPGTAIIAPLDGIVHSFAFNNRPGDYGTTIILSHQLQGHSFYTLYGHLSLTSIQNLQEGNRVGKGDIFAGFGIPAENGQWPPHLHFQVINDLQGWSGDYPGVCKYSEREKYLANCPDPDLILQLNQYL